MDKEIENQQAADAPYSMSDLERDIAAGLEGTEPKAEDPKTTEKPKRGRPRKADKKKEEEAKEVEEQELPDATGEEEPDDQDKPDDQEPVEDGTISIEDIPEEQRLEAATAIIGILTPEQKDALLDQVGGEVAKELQDLRASKKALEDQVKEIERKSRSQIDKIISPNSYFADVNTEAELDEKEKKIRGNLAYFDDLIDSTDEVFTIGEKEYTRAEVRNFRNQYRKLSEDAKEHRYRIREVAKYREKFNEATEQVSRKYDWYADESGEKRKKYDSLIQDIDLNHLKYVAPKSAALLPDIIAKYVSADEQEQGARRIFKLPIKQTKPKQIRIASGGGVEKTTNDAVADFKHKKERGELTMGDLERALAASL